MAEGNTVVCVGVLFVFGIGALLLVVLLPLSFHSLEYYEYGFAKDRTTGTVDTSKVYAVGKHLLGPAAEFKIFRADAHTVVLRHIAAFTSDKLEVKVTISFQYFLRKLDLPLLHKAFDLYYEDVMESKAVDALKVKLTASFQYFLRKLDLPLLHKTFDLYYEDVMKSKGVDALKSAVTVFSKNELFLKRSLVEKTLFKAVRERLGGICCPPNCEKNLHGCPAGCKASGCTDKDKGVYVDVKFFQLTDIEIPSEVVKDYTRKLLETENAEKEKALQDAQIIRKNINQDVKRIRNEATEISEEASAQAGLIKVKSQADYVNMIESARSKGLKALYTGLNITEQHHKNSFDYLRTLRGLSNVHLTVDFQQHIVGTL